MIEKRLRRHDCLQYMKDNNLPLPMKSSCVFCPYHDNKSWEEIQNDTELWKIAIDVDESIRNLSNRGEEDKMYLHKSCKPLKDIDFTDNQIDLFDGFDNECDGVCGI